MTTLIENLLQRTDKGQLRVPLSFFILCCMALIGYVFIIEFLYHHSKLSYLQGLPFILEISLLLRSFILVMTVVFPFLILGSGFIWWLSRRRAYKSALLLSLLVHPLPFLIFALCNYFFLDRWTYSVFEYNMAKRSSFINILLFVLFITIGYILYFVNARQIAIFTNKHKKIIVSLFLLLMGCGGGIVLYSYSHRIHYGTIPALQKENVALPNIIILSYDMFEATHTPLVSYHRNTTPNLLRRKNDFFIFSNNVAIAIESRSGTVGLLTGRSPSTTKVLSHPDRLQGRHVYEHWPAQLKSLGYYNANFGDDPYSNPSYYNMLNGFTEINGKYIDTSSIHEQFKQRLQFLFPGEYIVMKEILEEYQLSIEYTFGISDTLAKRKDVALVSFEDKQFPDVYKKIESLLQEKIPFMIHYHSNITHQPIDIRKYKIFSKIPDAISEDCAEMRRKFKICDGENLTEEDLIDLYDDALLQMDEEVEEVIRLLEKYRCYENTLLILTTDHEYMWGSSGHPIALIMRIPGFSKGRIISERTWMLDIAPTVYDLIGIPIPKWMEGESLLPLIQGKRRAKNDRLIHIIRGNLSQLLSVTVLQSENPEIPPEFFDTSKGFRELEKKIEPSNDNHKTLEKLHQEALRLEKKASAINTAKINTGILNESMENGESSPQHWWTYSNDLSQEAGWIEGVAHSGSRSIKLKNTSGANAGWRGETVFFSKPYPKSLKLGGWAKAEDVASGGIFAIDFYIEYEDGSYTWYYDDLRFNHGTHDWENTESTVTFNKGVRKFRPYCLLYSTTGTAWFDDVYIYTKRNE